MQGLAPRTYDVYVYVDGDNRSFTRTAAYTISGAGINAATITASDTAEVNFATAFTAANDSSGNYVRFRISGSAFTLTARPLAGTNATLRAPINGLQVVPR